MSHHCRCGHAASRADGREPWHARKPLGSSVWATGGTFLSANVELTALAGQGADALLIRVGWPFGPGHGFRWAASLEHSTKERPRESLRRRGSVFGNGPENLISPWLEGVEGQGCVGDRYWTETAFHFCWVRPRREPAGPTQDGHVPVSYTEDQLSPCITWYNRHRQVKWKQLSINW